MRSMYVLFIGKEGSDEVNEGWSLEMALTFLSSMNENRAERNIHRQSVSAILE